MKKNNKIKKITIILGMSLIVALSLIFSSLTIYAKETQKKIVITIKIANPSDISNNEDIGEDIIKNNNISTKEYLLNNLSENELYFFAECVELEACGGGLESKQAVANAIVNRVNSNYFPNSFESVVTQNENGTYQFSSYAKGWGSKSISNETYEACKNAFNGEDLVNGATYFANLNICKGTWFYTAESNGTLIRTIDIGGHTFFRLNQ